MYVERGTKLLPKVGCAMSIILFEVILPVWFLIQRFTLPTSVKFLGKLKYFIELLEYRIIKPHSFIKIKNPFNLSKMKLYLKLTNKQDSFSNTKLHSYIRYYR